MELTLAPNFERFLEERGYLEVEEIGRRELAVPLQPRARRHIIDYAVKLDGEEIGTYTLIYEGDDIRNQVYEGRVPDIPILVLETIK